MGNYNNIMLGRFFKLFFDSFKYLYREKLSFFISSSTIALCIFIISIVSIIGYYSIDKIMSLNSHEISISFNDCTKIPPSADTPFAVPVKLIRTLTITALFMSTPYKSICRISSVTG